MTFFNSNFTILVFILKSGFSDNLITFLLLASEPFQGIRKGQRMNFLIKMLDSSHDFEYGVLLPSGTKLRRVQTRTKNPGLKADPLNEDIPTFM